MPDQNFRLVYSTGSVVPPGKKPAGRNLTASAVDANPKTIVRLERKGRGGKSVTIIEGLPMPVKNSEKPLKQ